MYAKSHTIAEPGEKPLDAVLSVVTTIAKEPFALIFEDPFHCL